MSFGSVSNQSHHRLRLTIIYILWISTWANYYHQTSSVDFNWVCWIWVALLDRKRRKKPIAWMPIPYVSCLSLDSPVQRWLKTINANVSLFRSSVYTIGSQIISAGMFSLLGVQRQINMALVSKTCVSGDLHTEEIKETFLSLSNHPIFIPWLFLHSASVLTLGIFLIFRN